MQSNKKGTLNKAAFWPAFVALVLFIGSGVFFQEQVGSFLHKTLYAMAGNVGWYFNILAMLSVLIVLVILVMKYGDVKIGGSDAKPEFSMFHWIAMSICGGIGTGLLFWAMGEPIYHFTSPPVAAGVEAMSREAGIFAVSQAMWNWSFIQYSMYSICAVAFALAVYNKKKELSFGTIIESSFGRKIPWLETVIHGFTIFCLTGAVANSMGVGLMQIGAGVESVFGIKQSPIVWFVVASIIAVIFILSCVSGLAKGLKRVSTFTITVFIGMLVYVFIFGDTAFITKIGTEAVGSIIDNWGSKTLMMNAMAPQDTWYADWIVQYWASFIVYAPVIGMFLSRLSKGRTVKQFVAVNVVVPSLFCWVWIMVFGGMTISLQYSGAVDVIGAVNEFGMQAAVFQILGALPFGKVLIVVFLVAIFGSFSTLADPMAAVLATVSTRGLTVEDEAPKNIKIVMGLIMAVTAYLLVASGGVNSVKGLYVIVGLPISFVMIMCFIAAFKGQKECYLESAETEADLRKELEELKSARIEKVS
ncbi:BCCT family transporter [Gottschalkiaceae bacterium SANA]|nr:BCCT family transporter [Gottschalkiaceae bacterium SANA]